MKKRAKWMLVAMVAGLLAAAGCGNQSGLEGTIVDAKGRPISGLTVIARQVRPVKGNEQFETQTDSGGRFSFKTFYPSSEYVISVIHKDWRSDAAAHVSAGPEGKTVKLPEPIRILFGVSGDGVITDFMTGMEWMAGPDKDTNWDEAKAWCSNLSVAGGGWRMPTRAELKTLYINGFGKSKLESVFKATVWGVWSGERIRIDRESEANHDLIRWLNKPGVD
ncbi:MAG: DUF1566 domain-containing protein [Desulfosalsimonadaceae bacterium]